MSSEAQDSANVTRDKLAKIIPTLAVVCSQKGENLLHDLLQASTYEVENISYDSWNGGHEYEHRVLFLVPPDVFLRIDLDNLAEVVATIGERLNGLLKLRNESISEVALEISEPPTVGGVVLHPREHEVDLWPGSTEFLRLFVSHRAVDSVYATALKAACQKVGISCFVAHEDIEPGTEWQEAILRALRSMDMLVALLTSGFHESEWTDQEVGVAIGRDVPVVPVKLGEIPYGFIGKFQALPGRKTTASTLAEQIVSLAIDRLPTVRRRMQTALVARFEAAPDYDNANEMLDVLLKLTSLPLDLIERIETAPARNAAVAKAFRVQKRLPGLLEHWRAGIA
ncbi:MAG: toll/interleukin-1 receptor domain-containing protein [Armatimonadota bacterium]